LLKKNPSEIQEELGNEVFFQNIKKLGDDRMSESKDYENEEKEIEERYEVIRITSLKSNGSVWTKQYEGKIDYNQVIPILLEKFPHVILSRQLLRQAPMDYLLQMGVE
jgi:hypothetical protein